MQDEANAEMGNRENFSCAMWSSIRVLAKVSVVRFETNSSGLRREAFFYEKAA
jgi:hypothetical protein